MTELSSDTPMFRQYRELKAAHPDALLFFRMGDFYELFGEDAVWTAAALELTLTSRNKDQPDPVPMCGVPHHAAEGYVRRLLDLGRKIAIADQVEDPRLAKGIVRREVVRVVTPGLAGDAAESHEPAFLAAVGGGPGAYGFALLDVSTGDLRATEVATLDALLAEIVRAEPKEAILGPEADDPEVRAALGGLCVTRVDDFAGDRRALERRFGPCALGEAGVAAACAALRYAEAHLRSELRNVVTLRPYTVGGNLEMDEATRRNLELFRPLRGAGRKGTLLHLLDEARTPMGGRLLREWLAAPLREPAAIEARLDAVQAFVDDTKARERAGDALKQVADVERIAGRVAQGTAPPRDLAALRTSLERLPALAAAASHPALAGRLGEDFCDDVIADVARWLVDEPPATLQDGGVIRPGADPELDRLRELALDAKGAIARMEGDLRDATGVASLKIRHNAVFGYYIEVTKANLHRVPASWHRKQTIATGERYITPELKEYEEAVQGADEKRVVIEAQRYNELRQRVSRELARILAVARGIAELDVLSAFAELAVRHRYTRPCIDTSHCVNLTAARHPVVEATYREERFVPNDVRLDEQGRLVILTGPNMAGKSTLMRQVALIVLMAQMGSFVPATSARVGVCDRVFVRVGASDDLSRGRSTFMVEMAETANILSGATAASLVLLDEIGRGTSTYDGLAIAWAVAEDLHDRVKCRAIFATHYHELAALSESSVHVRNMHVAVAEHGEKVVFLRKVKPGPASGSYGIQCARLAGLPMPVVDRAKQLLKQLEKRRPKPEATQLSLFGAPPEVEAPPPEAPLADPIRDAVAALDLDGMTARDALAALYRLREML
ncbi:MAG: DNA mismatch repair protein MutS [Myxococcota bacterium]